MLTDHCKTWYKNSQFVTTMIMIKRIVTTVSALTLLLMHQEENLSCRNITPATQRGFLKDLRLPGITQSSTGKAEYTVVKWLTQLYDF